MLKKIFIFLIIPFLFYCPRNGGIDSKNTVSYKEAKERIRQLSLLFVSRGINLDPFQLGIIGELEPTSNCNRNIHYDEKEFENCEQIIILFFLGNPNTKNTGIQSIDIFRNICNVKKVYFLEDGNLDGEINTCKLK
ncbi:MAG: hypothetical protein MH321_04935 [Leptospiraceae bacterium]|jgi:hypothetical protein|nr:hypothetical protein [Leptospiraceae bacterium]